MILTGAEAHVCVLQTALDLTAQNYAVHIARDAVCSRHKSDWKTSMSLLEQAGAIITSTEITIFQLLARADTEDFRKVQKLLK